MTLKAFLIFVSCRLCFEANCGVTAGELVVFGSTSDCSVCSLCEQMSGRILTTEERSKSPSKES